MNTEPLVLRFDDHVQAAAVLGALGIGTGVACGYGILHEPSGETAEFEGEVLVLTRPSVGYHVRLAWRGEIPSGLLPHLVPQQSCPPECAEIDKLHRYEMQAFISR